MGFIRNILALLGLAAIAVMVWVGPTMFKYKVAFDGFDAQAFETYKGLGDRLIEHENAVGATVWSAKVAEDLTSRRSISRLETSPLNGTSRASAICRWAIRLRR